MYGARGAFINWHEEYSQQLVDSDSVQGISPPCAFYHPVRRIRICEHGDDYVSPAQGEDFNWMEARLQSNYQIETKWLGRREGREQDIEFSNRVVLWTEEGIKNAADPRHAELMVKGFKLTERNDMVTPGAHDEGKTSSDKDDTFEPPIETCYRALVVRADYLSPDRPDISFIAKEFAKVMAQPTVGDGARLTRMVRYLVGRPGLTMWHPWQEARHEVTSYTDADWAGDQTSRRSTSGGCLAVGEKI